MRGASLGLGLLDRLSLVSLALLVLASSSVLPSGVSTSSLAITLLLFEGWLIWTSFDCTELVGVARGSLLALSLFPDQSCSASDLCEVQRSDLLFLAHDLGDAVHGWRELRHNDHGLEVFGDL